MSSPIGRYDPRTEAWTSWPSYKAFLMDPNNPLPHWRICGIMERSEKECKLLEQVRCVKRRKGFAQL